MRFSLIALLAAVVSASPASAQDAGPHNFEARAILKELVEINTTDSSGSTTKAAEAMAARLKAAGFADADVQVLGPNPRKGNLVARLRGRSAGKPILLLAHLDVVEALKADWSADLDPFVFTERDGYFYGRGTSDDKAHAAIWISNLIRYRQEGFVPSRDIVVALTADEEGGDSNGVKWLLEHHRSLIDAEFVLNEGGGGELRNGKAVANSVQAAEKMYYSFAMEVRNPGGHSSLPRKDNAIYRLAAGLTRLAAFEFPVQLNEITRGFFAGMAELEGGKTAADLRAAAGPRPGGRRPPGCRIAALQLDDALHVRGDPADRRPRRERAAAAGAGRGQLPPAPGLRSARGRTDAEEGGGRRGDRLHDPVGTRGEPGLTAAAGRDGGHQAAHGRIVAWRGRAARHVHGRNRRGVPAERRHPHLRRGGRFQRSERRAGPRAG
jgi:hypothetical protein